MVKISDITINYNNCSDLKNTLESLMRQEFKEVEIIIIDGGSNDGSVELLAEYSRKFLETGKSFRFVSEKDTGRYNAMNKGIRLASGEWVMFLNAGDVLDSEDTLSDVIAHLEKTNASIVYGDNKRVYNNGIEYHKAGQKLEYIKKGLPFSHQSVFTRTELFKKRGYDEQLQISGDYEWFLDSYLKGYSFEYMPICVSIFDMNGVSNSKRFDNYKEVLLIRKKHHVQDFIFIRGIKLIVWWLIDKLKLDNKKVIKYIDKKEIV